MTEVRVEGLRARLSTDGVAALAVIGVPNITYLTGFSHVFDDEPAHVALVTSDACTLYTDSRYAEAVRSAADGTPWRIALPAGEVLSAVRQDLMDAGITKVAIESTLPYRRFERFRTGFTGEVVAADGWVEDLRRVKDADEIASITAAQALTDAAFEHILAFVKAGVTERDIALELEFFMRKQGSDGVAFAPIVASGPNSAKPHAAITDRAFTQGDFVVMDFGARIDGYCADMTRTVVIGRATDRHREIYEAVLAANIVGIAAVKAGLLGKQIDAAARAVIEERGFAQYFEHGLGHGVGLEVHEMPGLGPRSTKPVPEGSVVTVEPGVYVPGFGGVRIEDLVVVEADHARVLTRSAKDLLEL
ncbi:MAG: aminopeptidase P family protein [Coriobacteriia bacterium]|nr:aminopeptidase P family protein [Coriobacteriia bacterium]